MSVRKLCLAVALAASAMWLAPAAQAASVTNSANCPGGVCATFAATDTIPVIKTFQFSMPSPGLALVQFNGTLYCGASSVTPADRVIDLVSGITTASSQVPVLTGVSTIRHAHVLKDTSDHAFDPSTSFNLASIRLVNYTTAGLQTVYFKINRARQDEGVNCTVYGGQFVVTRFP